jgi:HEAT repeat protein
MRASAAHALGVIGDPRAIDGLALLLRDERYFVRVVAARAMGQIGEPALARVLEMTASSTPALRESAIEALGSINSPRAISRIIEALSDPSNGVRSAAVRALGESGSEQGVSQLIAILRDDQNPLRAQAGASLARLGPRAVPEPWETSVRPRRSSR